MRHGLRYNPPNPFHDAYLEAEPDVPDLASRRQPPRHLSVRSALSRNDSPDIPFRDSINPYRGCHHGCAYCYARPTHQYLDEGSGTDFERHVYVKDGLLDALRRELGRRRNPSEPVVLSGGTDPYQPLEASTRLTRACLQLLLRYRVPVTVVTKSRLVVRDTDLLQALHHEAGCRVILSIPSLDPHFARCLEPGASRPRARLAALEHLASAGVPTGVSLAPVVPALTDHEIPSVLQAAAAAGARHAFMTLLRLPEAVAPVFAARLRAAYPHRAQRVLAALRSARGGRLDDPRFGHRMRGTDTRWQLAERTFALWCDRLGIARHAEVPLPSRPRGGVQLGLPLDHPST